MDRRSFIAAAGAAMLIEARPALAQFCAGHGQYVGELDLRALPSGRKMQLLKRYAYVDPSGLVWEVPEGVELDGASIPQVFWSIVGGPWDGPYRHASVIHDWYCMARSRPWQAVHRMFHEAMLAACTSRAKAGAMFAAVWVGGPRWPAPNPFNARFSAMLGAEASDFRLAPVDAPAPPIAMSIGEFEALAARIEREELGRAEIEALLAR